MNKKKSSLKNPCNPNLSQKSNSNKQVARARSPKKKKETIVNIKSAISPHSWLEEKEKSCPKINLSSFKNNLPAGSSFPLGATPQHGGVNFSLFSKNATEVTLLLFDHVDDATPAQEISLDPLKNRSYHYWHLFVPTIGVGQIYAWSVGGPSDPSQGILFDPNKVLLDPYGKCVARPKRRSRQAAILPGKNGDQAFKNVVVDLSTYDWEGDSPLRHPFCRSIIYELYLPGFTKHPSSGLTPHQRGTFAGLIEKIPYLKDLGITAVELLPIFAFDEQAAPEGLTNAWGYQPLAFFAPHPQYASCETPELVLNEFRDMVKALHQAGIEIILDVVFNHTGEGGVDGPMISFKGLANETYYILEENKAHYANFTGCGNTLNTNNSVVRRMILDALRYWVEQMHVDGFRFDLASSLSRDVIGAPMSYPPILWDIESDPVLSQTKLIAEAWDAAGLYQVGTFPGDAWNEWNGRFRDDVRSFLKGDENVTHAFAQRLIGSPDIYEWEGREPAQSINFVTCHDGFTLNDLVSYNEKHNEANQEGNRDGCNNNISWNCGVEGPSEDPIIESLRLRQIKNFFTSTLLSVGTPMLLAGDEIRRSQLGNNNSYAQEGPLSWFDWALLEKHAELHHFVKRMIAFRSEIYLLCHSEQQTLKSYLQHQNISWHGTRLHHPDFSHHSHSLAMTLALKGKSLLLHMMINAFWEKLSFEVPSPEQGAYWHQAINTAATAPKDIFLGKEAPLFQESSYDLEPRSIVVLLQEVKEVKNS